MHKEDIALGATGARSYERHWRAKKLSWNAIANPNDHDKIADNLHVHKNSINMKMLLAGNPPKFHDIPMADAYKRISEGLQKMYEDSELCRYYFGDFIYHYGKRYKLDPLMAREALRVYINRKLIDHMSRRVGIENWPAEAIGKWLKNIFGVNKLDYMLTAVKQTWDEYMEEKIGSPKAPF